MGQVFLNSLDQCGSGMGWQNLRKWEKIEFGQKSGQKHPKKSLKRLDLVWYGLVMTHLWSLVNPEMSKQKKIISIG